MVKKQNKTNIINKHPPVYTTLACTLRQVCEGGTPSLNDEDRTGTRSREALECRPAKDARTPQLRLGGYSVHKTDFISNSKPPIALTGKVDTVTTDIPVRGWKVTMKVSNETSEPLRSCRLGSVAWPRGLATGLLFPGRGECQAGQPALSMWPGEEPWPKGSSWPSLAGAPRPCSGGGSGSRFKFRVTVSVAPRPEDSEAKLGGEWGYACGGCTDEGGACMCSWVTRGDMEKLLELVRGTLKGTERDGVSPRRRVRLLRGECHRK